MVKQLGMGWKGIRKDLRKSWLRPRKELMEKTMRK